MPEQDTEKEIEERLAQLPEDIRDAILASDFDQKVLDIGKAHNLHIDQSTLLGTEIYMIMLGMIPTASFVDNVVGQVRVSKEEAEKISADVNAKILAPIRESMKRVYEQDDAPAAAEKSVVMPSSLGAAPKSVVPAPVADATAMPKPPIKAPDLHPAEVVLTEKTIQVAPTTPKLGGPEPGTYKADPYREPIE